MVKLSTYMASPHLITCVDESFVGLHYMQSQSNYAKTKDQYIKERETTTQLDSTIKATALVLGATFWFLSSSSKQLSKALIFLMMMT